MRVPFDQEAGREDAADASGRNPDVHRILDPRDEFGRELMQERGDGVPRHGIIDEETGVGCERVQPLGGLALVSGAKKARDIHSERPVAKNGPDRRIRVRGERVHDVSELQAHSDVNSGQPGDQAREGASKASERAQHSREQVRDGGDADLEIADERFERGHRLAENRGLDEEAETSHEVLPGHDVGELPVCARALGTVTDLVQHGVPRDRSDFQLQVGHGGKQFGHPVHPSQLLKHCLQIERSESRRACWPRIEVDDATIGDSARRPELRDLGIADLLMGKCVLVERPDVRVGQEREEEKR